MSNFISGRQSEIKVGIVSYTENKTVLSAVGSANFTGIVTATGGFNLGISSAGTSITSGPITALNFIGAGNTFAINGTTVDISIAGGGGGGGASVSISTVAPSSPSAGDLWYNSNLGRTFIYYNDGSSSQWVDSSPYNLAQPSLTPGKTSTSLTATLNQTTFSTSYTPGYVDVYLNGVRLTDSEFVASNGSTITLIQGASAGDVVDVIGYTMGIGATGAPGASGPLSPVTGISTLTASPQYPLFVSGVGTVSPYITTTSNYFSFIPSTGTLSVNQLVVAGVATATDFNSTSDINLKTNIKVIDNPLAKVMQINGVSFDWKHVQQSSAGVIAQDVEKVLPEIVSEAKDGHKTLNYNGLIGLLIEAVKEQQEQINTLKEEIEHLKK